MSGPEWRSCEEAVQYARTHPERTGRMSRVQGFITQGWWPPEPEAHARLLDLAVAVLAEANKRGIGSDDGAARERTGKAMFT
jgi:hypothetical protein